MRAGIRALLVVFGTLSAASLVWVVGLAGDRGLAGVTESARARAGAQLLVSTIQIQQLQHFGLAVQIWLFSFGCARVFKSVLARNPLSALFQVAQEIALKLNDNAPGRQAVLEAFSKPSPVGAAGAQSPM